MNKNYREMFSRNIGLLTEKDQDILSNSCVAIAGVGGVGGIQLVTLARTGIGNFLIADPEVFSITDINRQYGATKSTMGVKKAVVMSKIIKDINPYCNVKVFSEGVNSENVERFVKGSDVVIDAIEYFTIEEKIRLYKEARKNNKFVFTSPIIGFGSTLLVFDPSGLSYEDYFELDHEKNLDFKKLCPIYPEYIDKDLYQNAKNKKRPFPSFSPSTALSAGLLSTEVVLFILNRRKPAIAPKCIQVDYHRQSFDIIDVTKKDWRDFWTKFSEEAYDNIALLPENKKMINQIAELAGENNHVLDAGCGTGNVTLKLAEKNKVDAIDFSKGMVKIASEKTKKLDNVTIQEGNATCLDFEDNKFDAVVLVNVLFNLDNPEKVISEANRVLKKKGKLILSNPLKGINLDKDFTSKIYSDLKKLKIGEDKINKIFGFNKKIFSNGGIKFTPTLEEFKSLIINKGFSLLNISKLYYNTNILIVAKKIK